MTAAAAMTAEELPSIQRLRQAVEAALEGKHEAVELALVALLARGHLLIEDVPGKRRWPAPWPAPLVETCAAFSLQAIFFPAMSSAFPSSTNAPGNSSFGRAPSSPMFSWLTRSTARVHERSRRFSRP
jgi:hypothetical protein